MISSFRLWRFALVDFFTSQLSLTFRTCLLANILGHGGLPLEPIFVRKLFKPWDQGWKVPLAINNCRELLAWFPARVGLLDRLSSCLTSLIWLTGWPELGAIISSRWDNELAFPSWWGGRMSPRALLSTHRASRSGEVPGSAPQTGKGHELLCLSSIVNTDAGWASATHGPRADFPGQVGWSSYSATDGAMNQSPCLSATRKVAPKLLRLFVLLTQADPPPKFLGWTGPLAWLWGWSPLSMCLSAQALLGYVVASGHFHGALPIT